MCSTTHWFVSPRLWWSLTSFRNNDEKLSPTFNSSFPYITDVFYSIIIWISYFQPSKGYYWHSKVKNVLLTSTFKSPWNWQRSKIKTELYDKRDDLTFPIVNISLISRNRPHSYQTTYTGNTASYKNRHCSPFTSTRVHSGFLLESVLLIFLFLWSFYSVFSSVLFSFLSICISFVHFCLLVDVLLFVWHIALSYALT